MPTVPSPTGLTRDEALAIARRAVAAEPNGDELVVLEDQTLERSFGWVFFYQTEPYLRTRDIRFMRPGIAPFVVDRFDGTVTFLTSSLPPDVAIDDFERDWKAARGQ